MEETKVEQVEETQGVDLKSLLDEIEGAPTAEQIEQWKQTYGEVFLSALTETELYIWKPLGRAEWRKVQSSAPEAVEAGVDLEREVLHSCLLWATKEGSRALDTKAGSVSTLHEQLLQNSNFLDPRFASVLVTKL